MANIRPDVHILEAFRAAKVDYPVLVGEGIDNAFDADANRIAVTIGDDLINLQDDGAGITKRNELALFRFGQHGPMSTTALGRYGIGIKYHAVNAGNILEARSTSIDGIMSLRVDWSALIRSRDWDIDDPDWTPIFPGTHTGTQVIIRDLRQRPPTSKILDKTRDEIAQRFYPAIAAGRVITFNGATIPLLEEPRLLDVIETDLTFPDDRIAHVRAGLLADRKSRLRQVQVSYRHRVIMPMCDFGCGPYNGIEAMFARIDLTGPWGLGRFKDALVDDYRDDLAEKICEILEPILERCANETLSAELEEITRQLNEMVPPEMIPVRPVKKQPKLRIVDRPPREPKASEHHDDPHGQESATGPARTMRIPSNSLQIEFVDQPNDEFGYGSVSFAKSRKEPNRVKLTKDNPHIVELRASRDRVASLRTLFQIALMLYEHAREVEPDQRELQFEQFGLRVWKTIERQNLGEARDIIKQSP
jgi:hypothetical protein